MSALIAAVLFAASAFAAGPPMPGGSGGPPMPGGGGAPASPSGAPAPSAPAPSAPAPSAPAPAAPSAAPAAGTSARSTRIPSPGAKPAKVSVSSAAAPGGLAMSTYTVSTLYTGDRVRDPFLPSSMGGAPARRREEAPAGVDVHALQLRGIMKDAAGDFALFSTDEGLTLMLKRGKLYDERNKPVPGITGQIFLKQKQAKLVTADRDEQYYSLEEINDDDAEPAKP